MIAHKLYGQGPVRLLILHGWFGDSADFDAVLPALDPEVYSVAVFDYRGYGGSADEPGPFDLRRIAADGLELADRLCWRTFSVIGHSMGGKAALLLAAMAPERVRKLVGVTPVFSAPVPFDCETADFFARAADEVDLRAAIIHDTTGRRLPNHWSASVARASWKNSRKEAFAGYFRSWSGDNYLPDTEGVAVQMLVIGGAHDVSITEDVLRATWLAAYPSAKLAVIAAAGHYPMMETPLALAALLDGFLRE